MGMSVVDVGRRGEGESRGWVFSRLGGGGGGGCGSRVNQRQSRREGLESSALIPTLQQHQQRQQVCHYWKAGRCHRRSCPYLHCDNTTTTSTTTPKSNLQHQPPSTSAATHDNNKLCRFWMADPNSCAYGDNCRFLHKRFNCDGLTMLAHLPGHHNAITGIALPQASSTLFSASKDESARAWDCVSGHSAGLLTLGAETGSLIAKGPWLFVGIPNAVRAWNSQTNTDFTLDGPVGQVYALVCTDAGMLFAGTQDGTIFVWRFNEATGCFDPLDALKGHTLGVVALAVGANTTLYSGSMDNTIRVWDLGTLQCTQTLTEHASVVMSLLCWDQFLLSSSLDGTVKVWAFSQNQTLEVVYSHTEQHGVLRLCGVQDAESKPVLLCSCNNNVVYLYDLPSFHERGRIFSKEEVRAMEAGPQGLFFTGDATGDLRVWKWSEKAAT